MGRRLFTAEQIIGKLRETEVLLAQEGSVGEASRRLGITERTYYRRRKGCGGVRVNQARRLKELVADISLDNAILKEATKGNP